MKIGLDDVLYEYVVYKESKVQEVREILCFFIILGRLKTHVLNLINHRAGFVSQVINASGNAKKIRMSNERNENEENEEKRTARQAVGCFIATT